MEVTLYTDDLNEAAVDFLALPIGTDEPDRGLAYAKLNKKLDGFLEQVSRDEAFSGKADSQLTLNLQLGKPARRVFLYGMGAATKFDPEAARKFAGAAVQAAEKAGAKTLLIQLPLFKTPVQVEQLLTVVQAITEGAELGRYRFDVYQSRDVKPQREMELQLAFAAEDVPGVKSSELRLAIQRGQSIAGGVAWARDLVNLPPNDLFPAEMADRAKQMAKSKNLSCKILGPRELKQQGMRLHLAVGQGSANEPRLIHLSYAPENAKDAPVIALVGKGICFDSGGLSLKTGEGMMDMKVDMGGAAAVLGAMQAIAEIAPEVAVHGIIAAAENMPGGRASRPGDVVKSKKGLTVEILNTDAEGRLVLADALAYAGELNPDAIVDLATLTGACMVALGPHRAAAYMRGDRIKDAMTAAWQRSGELFWPMPLAPEIKSQLKSDIADLKNIGLRWGGSISAALFLEEFVPKETAWAHLDIAGPVTSDASAGYVKKGATGFGVRSLVELVSHFKPKAAAKAEG